jgi:hemerythrin
MIKEFEWIERYVLGIPEIDEQHLELVKRINAFVNAFNEGKGDTEIKAIVSFLEEYVVSHFNDEEALMERYRYLDLDEHHSIHDTYMRKVNQLVRGVEENGSNLVQAEKVQLLLIDWLSNHIDVEDRKFAEHIKQSAVL